VTARAGAPFVKRYREERELTVVFLVDVSASGMFGTVKSASSSSPSKSPRCSCSLR